MLRLILSLPVLVFQGPESCPAQRADPCKSLLQTMQHPAIVRRLDEFEFRVEPPKEGERPSLLVRDAAGHVAVQWYDVPSLSVIVRILKLIDNAMPYLDATDRYDPALASLALGDRTRGERLLEELQRSDDAEARELATIWIRKLNEWNTPAPVEQLANNGVTPRVRFEAWMELARLHMLGHRVSEALAAVEKATENARTANERKIALLTRQRYDESRAAILGLGLSGELVSGSRTLQPRALPKSTTRVELRLDGKRVATSTRAPFATTIDFGRIPKRQVLELTALDASGKVVQRASAIVNERGSASSIEILDAANEISATVRPPRGGVAEEVRFEWNGQTLAKFDAPPYRATLRIGDEPGVLRAVARFDDGTEVEDARLLNTAAALESDVHLMEVPVYFESGKPSKVQVREKGVPRQVERTVPASEAPLRLALVLDSSASMLPHMLDLQEAALRFVEKSLDERDEVMVAGFGATIDVLRPTRDRNAIEHSILGLRPNGPTPLHDALIQSLLDLQVGGSRRALVVFSDGLDTSSTFDGDDVEEVARRVGVPVYVLAFRPPDGPEPPRAGRAAVLVPARAEVVRRAQKDLMALAKRTGGQSFELRSLDELGNIWNAIGADLRKQALVLFRTTPGAEDEWRTVTISAQGRGALRAPTGVYVTGRGRE